MEFEYEQEDLEGLDRIAVIAGPTGVGKTEFSLQLAERIGAEIVSVDSLQVYRRFDIGTDKVSRAARERVPHHLIDVCEPEEEFNAADFRRLAGEAIDEIYGRGNVPLLVGGTGLYIRLLVHGMLDVPEPSDELRAKYKRQHEKHGDDFLYRRLRQLDPELADEVHPNDQVRITRGLEVYDQTGKPLSQHQREHRFSTPNYHALKLVLIRPRPELYDRINRRVEEMIDDGLEEEYRALLDAGYDAELKPMQSIGYRQIGEYVAGDCSLDDAISEVQRQTRRYAKQQISWFRGEPQTQWAMAPLLRDGRIPDVVVDDIEAFFDGGDTGLEWANVDPYNVERGDDCADADGAG